MNQLSVFYEHIFEAASQSGRTVEDVLKYAKSCGIDALECDLGRLSSPNEAKELFDLCGMEVSCIYHFFDMPNDSAEQTAQKYRLLFETAEFFRCNKVLCVPGFYGADKAADKERIIARLNEMCFAAKEYGITVTLEDFDDISSPCCRCDDILSLMKNVDGLRYTFDMGNFRYCLEDAALCYEKLKKYIVHAHCKDRSYTSNNGEGKADISGAIMYPVVACEGIIGIPELVKQLLADGYDGTLAIEHFGAEDQLRYMKRSAENLIAAMKG